MSRRLGLAEADATLNQAQTATLIQRAIRLSSRYEKLGKIDDLNEAILLGRELLSRCPPGHPDRSALLNNLAAHLFFRYKQVWRIDAMNAAILSAREGLLLCPLGRPDRLTSLNNLAVHLSNRFRQLGRIDDLNGAISLDREALELCPPGHVNRSASLGNLAADLSARYNQLGEIDDLNEVILFDREALSLCPLSHPDHLALLKTLAVDLSTRYNQLKGVDDLNEAIVLDDELFSLCPPDHPGRSASLNNLAVHLSSRYDQLGEIDDLDRAIDLDERALSLFPPGHPDHLGSLNNLAVHLFTRYNQLGEIKDLNKAILFDREALSLCPPGHPDRPASSNTLALHLSSRYIQLEKIDDLSEAIILGRELHSSHLLHPPGHPNHLSLNDHVVHLSPLYDHFWTFDHLNEPNLVHAEVPSLHLPGHRYHSASLDNSAVNLSTQYNQLGEIDDLNEAILFLQEALSLRPPGHPDRWVLLNNLVIYLSSRLEHLRNANDHRGATKDEQELFSLFTESAHVSHAPSSHDLSIASAWVNTAEAFHHHTTVLAYETALRLLVEYMAVLAPLPQCLALLESASSSLAVDAFSACLRNKSAPKAVELLEQGRSIFWDQLSHPRSPVDDIIVSGPEGKVLADEFTRLALLIRTALQSPGVDQHDQVCNLNCQLQKVVFKIRELPGYSRFLLPLFFSDLQQAASGGPVIIVNASKHGCDALIVFANKDPVHVPLSITNEGVRRLSSKFRDLTDSLDRINISSSSKELVPCLQELWDSVVSHIISSLQTECQPNSRIWWCPTAKFSLLPLHAASPFKDGQKGVPELYISSYTPTLNALVHARRPHPPNAATGKKRFIAIGNGEFLGVKTELGSIERLVDGLVTFTKELNSCVSGVADELCRNEWVHFACGGDSDEERPFESALRLHDGLFTIQHIIQRDLLNPEFAYLSASKTTVGDKRSLDENIHLASAMQFAGFRSVIGTMGDVDDTEANQVASIFYSFMKDESGRLDYTRAAQALQMTMREMGVARGRSALYIHFGA